MTPDLNCDDLLPWFALTSGGFVIGTGFQTFGKLTPPQDQRDWFERPPARAAQVISFFQYTLFIIELDNAALRTKSHIKEDGDSLDIILILEF